MINFLKWEKKFLCQHSICNSFLQNVDLYWFHPFFYILYETHHLRELLINLLCFVDISTCLRSALVAPQSLVT